MTRRRMYDEAGGLIDDDQMFIFKNYVERDVLRHCFVGHRGRDVQFKLLSRHLLAAGVGKNLTIDTQRGIRDQSLNARA